jgi:hypothetical protein
MYVSTAKLYFHLVSHWEILFDEHGLDVGDVKTALPTIVRALGEIREEWSRDELTGWTVKVVDHAGMTLLSFCMTK